jgi:hypothetical protein
VGTFCIYSIFRNEGLEKSLSISLMFIQAFVRSKRKLLRNINRLLINCFIRNIAKIAAYKIGRHAYVNSVRPQHSQQRDPL